MGKIRKAFAITDAKISFVSLVDKASNQREFLIAKCKEGETGFSRQGKILKADAATHIITGVVYEPMVEDSQGNYMTEEEIVKASYWFAENGDKIDLQHNFEECAACTVVENWVTKSAETVGEDKLAKGTWIITVKVNDPAIWEAVENGDITGFSMGGIGKYSTTDDDIEIVEKGGNAIMEQQPEKRGILKRLAEVFSTAGFDLVEKGEMKDAYTERQKSSGFWNATDTLQQLLARGHWDYFSDRYVYDFETDDTKIREALTDFNEIITNLLASDSIAKALAENAPEQPITKAGKKMSDKNRKRLDEICQSMTDFQKEFDTNNDEEETEVKKEDILKMVEDTIAKAVAAPEAKPATTTDTDTTVTADDVQKMVEKAVAKAVAASTPATPEPQEADLATKIDEAVAKALAPLLKIRGLPSNLNDNPEPVQKAERHYLAGVL